MGGHPLDNCITVDFLKNQTISEEGITSVWVDLHNEYNSSLMSVEIIPLDRNLFTERRLKNTMLYYYGPNIVVEKNAPYGTYDDYILELKQDRYVENDPSKNCKNYPTRKHKSYNVCDKEFVRRTLTKHFGSEFVPFWATDDLDNVTRSHPVDWSYDNGPLFDGTMTSDCPLPCTTNSVNARFISRKKVENKVVKRVLTNITQDATTTTTHIMMTLAGKVEMTKTDFIQPTLSTVLSDVGGSLGLWLGLGALQAL